MSDRFTIDGSDALEQHLAQLCDEVLAGVREIIPPRRLEALLLGGGYGRGEGGVLATAEGDRPYNDLEFYVFVRGNTWLNDRRFALPLQWLAERLAPGVGVEIEFKVTSLARMRRSSITMFTYDLMMGHRCLMGSELLLAGSEHHCLASKIPLAEATRLLMNRCSGLLFARERLLRDRFTFEDADFVGRNLAKAQLGLGDSVLAALGQYHWNCRKRHQRLEKLTIDEAAPWLEAVQQHHTVALAFKLHPRRSMGGPDTFTALHEELTKLSLEVWLWLESKRLGQRFASGRHYAESAENKCPDEPGWHNLLASAQALGFRAALMDRGLRYPRERLLRALALLLWEPAALSDPSLRRRVQRDLRSTAPDIHGLTAAYLQLWRRFN
jgi:hypothetical protein